MSTTAAVAELLAALRQAYPAGSPEPDALQVAVPVAFTLQHTDSIGGAEQHRYDSLRAALALRRNGTLRKLCHELGFADKDAGTLSDLLHGRYDHVSLETANRWALALGLPRIPPTLPVAVCPSCLALGTLAAHGDGLDCHGRPVAAVVTLAPGETVRRNGRAPQRKEPPCFRPRLSLNPRERVGQLERLMEIAEQEIIDAGGEP